MYLFYYIRVMNRLRQKYKLCKLTPYLNKNTENIIGLYIRLKIKF